MKSTSVPAGTVSCTVTTLPVGKLPTSRHDHVPGSANAELAVVLYSGPPFTRKLNDRPSSVGDCVNLQIFRSPTVPPAGSFVNVTIVSFAAVEPGGT